MAEQTQTLHVDLHVHVLPLLDLCRYAAMASTLVEGVYDMAGVNADFDRLLSRAAPAMGELADYGGGAMVAGGLAVAMDLLREYAAVQDATPTN